MNINNIDFNKLESRLGNNWAIALISNMTPGVIRIQLMSPGEFEPGWRKCIEADTLQDAIDKAIKFTNSITWQDYGKKVMSHGAN